jgi:hypothetical protein
MQKTPPGMLRKGIKMPLKLAVLLLKQQVVYT